MRRLLGIKAKASKQPLANNDLSEHEPEPRQPAAAASVAAAAAGPVAPPNHASTTTLTPPLTRDRATLPPQTWTRTMADARPLQHQHHDPSFHASPSGRPLAPASSSSRDASTGLLRRSSLASLQSVPPPPVPPKDRRMVRVSLGSAVPPAVSMDQDQDAPRKGHHHSVMTSAPTANVTTGGPSAHSRATIKYVAPTPTPASASRPAPVPAPAPASASASAATMTTTHRNRISNANTVPDRSNSVASNTQTTILALERTTSPLSISPSSVTSQSHLSFASSPHLGGASWGVGSAPATWSELANPDLVDNVSARERTRQEILWEVVASEERYVSELRSLVNLYVAPLLHPLLTATTMTTTTTTTVSAAITTTPSLSFPSSPSPIPSVVSPRPSSSSSTPYQHSASTHAESSSDLPIAARFSRSLHTVSRDHLPEPGTHDPDDASTSPSTPRAGSRATQNSTSTLTPEEKAKNARLSLPTPASYRGPSLQGMRGRVYSSFGAQSTSTLLGPDPASSTKPTTSSSSNWNRFSTLSFKNAMASMRSVATPNHELADDAEELGPPPVLPDALRKVLESVVEMLKGHEVLASSLKEQWAKAFPLVRGLAAIWSDQPWFLETYASYVLSLEQALATIDGCIPSVNSTNKVGLTNSSNLGTITSKFLKRTSSISSQPSSVPAPLPSSDPANLQRLKRTLMHLEEKATEAGESGLGLCLSKPLMRLGKLPLLMQALLFHTDPTTHEWEKTRAMAFEVDELVRSIEDEKIEEEERSRARDGIARIDGIQDKDLMAPRRTRVLMEEKIAPADVDGDDSTAAVKERSSMITLGKKASKRTLGRSKRTTSTRGGEEWFVRFSDVTVRCVKVRETDLPFGCGFSKKGEGAKREKKLKKGKVRNLYRFVKVEKWETPEDAESNLAAWLGRSSQNEAAAAIEEADEATDDAESRMSFRYDADDPRPVSPRVFRASSLPATARSSRGAGGARKGPRQSTTTQSVAAKQSPAFQKYGQRLRVASETLPRLTSPVSRQRWETPTAASQARATPVGSSLTRASSRSPTNTPTIGNTRSGRGLTPTATSTKRASSAVATTSSRAGQSVTTTTSKKHLPDSTTTKVVPLSNSTTSVNGLGARDQSTMALYGKYWEVADGERAVQT